jgi:hypothetical protein
MDMDWELAADAYHESRERAAEREEEQEREALPAEPEIDLVALANGWAKAQRRTA